jgi:hypothetical protein
MESRVKFSRSNNQGPVTKSWSTIKCKEWSSGDHGQEPLLSPLEALQRFSAFDNMVKSKHLGTPRPKILPPNVKHSAGLSNCHETHPRKRAVLCGVTYQNNKYRLKGTINDVKKMKDLLIDRFDYSKECIRVLTGDY